MSATLTFNDGVAIGFTVGIAVAFTLSVLNRMIVLALDAWEIRNEARRFDDTDRAGA